jgi:hypothetical protein
LRKALLNHNKFGHSQVPAAFAFTLEVSYLKDSRPMKFNNWLDLALLELS